MPFRNLELSEIILAMGGKRIYVGASVLIVYIGDILFVLLRPLLWGVRRSIGCMLEDIYYIDYSRGSAVCFRQMYKPVRKSM